MNRLYKLFNKFLRLVLRELFFYTPFLILFPVGVHYTIKEFTHNYDENQFRFLFSAVGLTATFSGLCFAASSTANVKAKKKIFHNVGERLLHSSLLFSIAILVKFFSSSLEDYGISNIYFKFITQSILFIPGILFFYYGIIYITKALVMLHMALFEGNEKPRKRL